MSGPGPFQSRVSPNLWEEVWGAGLSLGLILIGSKMNEAKTENALKSRLCQSLVV